VNFELMANIKLTGISPKIPLNV